MDPRPARLRLALAVAIGALVVAVSAPAGAHITQDPVHNWNKHYRPLADERYYTKSQLKQPGSINTATNPVHWTKLKGVPGGLADGTDAIGPPAWKLGGNAGTSPGTDFIGTTDDAPFDIRVDGIRAIRIQPGASGAPSIIGGAGNNQVAEDVNGGFIGGGSSNRIEGNSAYASVLGGNDNTVGPNAEFAVAAGRRARALHIGSFVWADGTNADFASSAPNQFSVRANGGAVLTGDLTGADPQPPLLDLIGTAGTGALRLTTTGSDGIRIHEAGDDGIQIGSDPDYPNYGVYIPSPGVSSYGLWPNTAQAAGEWALFTVDKVETGGVSSPEMATVARVSGPGELRAGDIAAAAGVAAPIPGSIARLALVQPAADAGAIIGVVQSRMVFERAPGKKERAMHSVPGPARAGDYVSLVVLGVADVRVAPGTTVQVGQPVTVGTDGAARPLQTRTLKGMTVLESAPTIGIALARPDPATGLVPVFVSPR